MARISTPEVDIAIGNGTTWGTAADLTASNKGFLIHASQFSVSDTFGQYEPRDIGFDLFVDTVVRLERSVQVNITCDLAYDEMWLQILANFLGSDTSSPAEQTASQGDYLHNLDWTSSNSGKFQTLVWKVEDDYVLEIPSVKWQSITITSTANGVGTFSATGIGDRVVDNASVSNTVSEINALSYASSQFRAAPLGGANHYFRINAQGGGSLSGSNDMEILQYTMSLNRQLESLRPLRGSNTAYTIEPRQQTPTRGTLSFQLSEINDAQLAGYTEFLAKTEKKAELYIDGDIIGSTLNRSLKFQFPRLSPAASGPDGFGVPNNASNMLPTYTYDIIKASAAPTGMSGVTSFRLATTSTRSVRWLN